MLVITFWAFLKCIDVSHKVSYMPGIYQSIFAEERGRCIDMEKKLSPRYGIKFSGNKKIRLKQKEMAFMAFKVWITLFKLSYATTTKHKTEAWKKKLLIRTNPTFLSCDTVFTINFIAQREMKVFFSS